MTDWHSLEQRFRSLSATGEELRIDHQFMGDDERWILSGYGNPTARQTFQSLCALGAAGLASLERQVGNELAPPHPNPVIRWYALMGAQPGSTRPGIHGWQTNADGTQGPSFSSESIDRASLVAASLCAYLEALEAGAPPTTLATALASARYSGIKEHLRKAHSFLSDRPPDLPNAVKEAISGVEGISRLLLSDNGVTLGAAIGRLRARGTIPGPMAKTLEGLWGFASDSPGVRHGSSELPTVSEADAYFVLEASEAAIRYLLPLDAT